MSRHSGADPCPGWLALMAEALRTRAPLPQPAELGATAGEMARCLERAGQALGPATLPFSPPQGVSPPAPAQPPPEQGLAPHVLHADGGSRGNPGPAGAGAALLDPEGRELALLKRYLGVATNNVAEYQGLILGLEAALDRGVTRLEVRLDSELLVRQINGQYKVKAPHLLPLYKQARALLSRFESALLVHVPRAQNAIADQLANQAMDEG